MIRRFVVLSLCALALVLVMAAPAAAATPELRGVVSGSPYGASQGYIAVPVLYSKMTARRTGLKSPVGLMVVKRTRRIKVNGGSATLPVGLRVGDRFKGNADVSALNKRIFYPRITFEKAPVVYFRSKELSLSELTRMIQTIEKNLGLLGKYTFDGFNLTAAQIAGLQKQINDLRALIAGLPKVDLGPLQSQIDALNKQVADLLASLANYALRTDLDGLVNTTQVTTLINTAITDLLAAAGPIEDMIDAAVADLLAAAGPVQDLIDASIGNLATQAGLDAATTQITLLQSDLTDARADLTNVCEAVKGLSASIPAGALGTIGGIQIPATTYPLPVTLGEDITSICPTP